jgi:hypothetical protein
MWLGVALFFGAVVAPAVFSVLRSFSLPNANEIAGTIVTRSLSVVNISGVIIGLFLLVTYFISKTTQGRASRLIELVSILLIILASSVGHWVIAARMRALRLAMIVAPIDQVGVGDPRRIEFNTLHGYSVNALGLAMIAALITLVLLSRSQRT